MVQIKYSVEKFRKLKNKMKVNVLVGDDLYNETSYIIDTIYDKMQRKIDVFSFQHELKSNLIKDPVRKMENNQYKFSIRTTSPYAKTLEFGTDERYIYISDKPKAFDWVLEKFGLNYKSKTLKIGGPNSTIQRNNSERKFFFNSIDEFRSETNNMNDIVERLKGKIKRRWKS